MSPRHLVRRLAEEIRSVQRAAKGTDRQPHFSTGIHALDQLLPDRGLCRGMLIEWLPVSDEAASGTSLWALFTARAACGPKEAGMPISNSPPSEFSPLVVVDRYGTFYPPAAASWGMPLANMILVRPTTARDEAWALDQAVRSSAVAAVLAWPNRLDGRAFRRLQLAVESSGTIGVLVRPASAKTESTWADVRLQVGPLCRSGPGRMEFRFQISNFELGAADRKAADPLSGWHFRIDCLHARGCTRRYDPVYLEITPAGQIHELTPEEQSPSRAHAQGQSVTPNLKSAI